MWQLSFHMRTIYEDVFGNTARIVEFLDPFGGGGVGRGRGSKCGFTVRWPLHSPTTFHPLQAMPLVIANSQIPVSSLRSPSQDNIIISIVNLKHLGSWKLYQRECPTIQRACLIWDHLSILVAFYSANCMKSLV